jgi:methylated-DNA-[protein]-cysteine S-methyltransferase
MTLRNPRCIAQATFDTPLGTLLAAATPKGLAGLWFEGQAHHPGPLALPVDPAHRWIACARQELANYFAGNTAAFTVTIDTEGTAFQQSVWAALRTIAAGQTVSYRQIAQRIGAPQAVRAVGAAVGRNPVSIVIPCHRVLGQDGSLTGYAGGLQRKQALLSLEARSHPNAQALKAAA